MPSPPGPGEIAGLRRTYGVNLLCHRAGRDPGFRERLRRDPEAELRTLPLTCDERALLLAGDVTALYGRGAHPVLLVRLAALGLFGLDMETYGVRMAGAVRDTGTRSERTKDPVTGPAPAGAERLGGASRHTRLPDRSGR